MQESHDASARAMSGAHTRSSGWVQRHRIPTTAAAETSGAASAVGRDTKIHEASAWWAWSDNTSGKRDRTRQRPYRVRAGTGPTCCMALYDRLMHIRIA